MDYIANKKYFTIDRKKITTTLIIIGVGALVTLIGVILQAASDAHDALLFKLIIALGVVIIIVGSIFYNIACGNKSTDADLDEIVKKKTKDMSQKWIKKLDLERKMLKRPVPFAVEGYDFNGSEPLLVQVDKRGHYRSNYYKSVQFLFGLDMMYICTLRFSFTEEGFQEVDDYRKIPYTSFDKAYVDKDRKVQVNMKGAAVEIPNPSFVMTSLDGQPIVDISVIYSNDRENDAQTLNQLIQNAKDGKAL